MYFTDTTWGWFRGTNRMAVNPGGRSDFSEADAEEVSIGSIGTTRRRQLDEELARYGLTESDVTIYRDRDLFKDEWKIVLNQPSSGGTRSGIAIGTVSSDGVKVDGQTVRDTTATSRSQRSAGSYGGF